MDSIKRNLTTNFLFLQLIHFFILVLSCLAIDTISKNQLVLDGQTLVSEGKVFELGFFSPSGSHERYIGIWYREISVDKVVWVANHANPLLDTSGTLMIGSEGNLVLIDGKNHTIWSTAPTSTSSDIVAVLHDSGNLVLTENNSNANVLWESFNHPWDTFLGGMEIGLNTKTGDTTFLTSWRSDKDPSPGSFVCALDPQAVPQVIIRNGTVQHWRSGQWDGKSFIGVPGMNVNYLTGLDLVKDSERGTIYLMYATFNSSFPSALFLSSEGVVTEIYWDAEKEDWIKEGLWPDGPCDTYGMCGSFWICNDMETPICKCLRGYQPKSSEEWSKGHWTGGCERRIELQCEKSSSLQESKYGFFKLTGVKLPDFSDYLVVDDSINCEGMCLKNCSCVAYAYVNGIGCMVWEGNLIDIREFSHGGQDLYLQLAYSELGEKKKVRAFVIVLIIISMILSLGLVTYILSRWKTKLGDPRSDIRENFWHLHVLVEKWKTSRKTQDTFLPGDGVNQGGSWVVPFFSLGSIAAATDNFSLANKLGEGGFGPVYKGKLSSGQEIAVKRLSRSSGQGIEEFKNEVILISKLQHRNLVKLLGFCVEGEEKLLLYEYMPNKSLDTFLYGSRNVVLDWDQRYCIIEGIARGLLYLHRDSRLRVIHRDLKISNILLDEDMNPKISDFDMARTFCANQTLANTNRVVGT